ncbi:transposase [Chitinophaga pinensis]|uniref:transposase n=1 Tax=Chitinophaga pinensis TaxID=79329 RepID=UPI00398C60C7
MCISGKTQVCIVHQLRNSLKFVVWKDKKRSTIALCEIYSAPDGDIALATLQHLMITGVPNIPTSSNSGIAIGIIYQPF